MFNMRRIPTQAFHLVLETQIFVTQFLNLDTQAFYFVTLAAAKTRRLDTYKKAGDKNTDRERREKRQHSLQKSLAVTHCLTSRNSYYNLRPMAAFSFTLVIFILYLRAFAAKLNRQK